MAKQIKVDYLSLNMQLEEVMSRLQRPDIQVDEAVKLYEQGLKLLGELERYLKQAENKITKLKLQAAEKE